MKTMIVVTHLLGSGHLSRALTLGRAFVAQGHDTHVISGGFPMSQIDTPGLTLHQLPPLRSDGTDFSRLLGEDGTVADEAYHTTRQSQLLAAFNKIAPDILITELFPFGRRNLRQEFSALLGAAKASTTAPRIFASIRDILAPPSKPSKATFAADTIAQFYDGVLVHSDPMLIPLNVSWPVTPDVAGKLHYTGFVAAPVSEGQHYDGKGEILVSAGGGSVGDDLFETAIHAAEGSPFHWRLLVGGHDRHARVAALQSKAGANVIIEPLRQDYPMLLQKAAASVSFCGYNTAMDILQTGVPAVLVPFDEGSEVEQGLRARALTKRGSLSVLKSADLTAQTLRSALTQVIASGRCTRTDVRFDGARETVRICEESLP